MAAFFTVQQCFVARTKEEEEEIQKSYTNYREIISTLPTAKGWSTQYQHQYRGFWFQPMVGLEGIMWIQQHFKTRPTDVFLITSPKSGTTWLKALIFSVMNRTRFDFSLHPLLTTSPHDCVPFMEADLFKTTPIGDPDLMPSPRIFATHMPYTMLPESMKTSTCPIVYICRNPKDVFISMWQFVINIKPNHDSPISLEDAFDLFCNGFSPFGPYWDHVLAYWKASLDSPNKILFLKYEDVKSEPIVHVKRLAEFLGLPFSSEEEDEGVVQEILKLCSFENMKNLEVNKTGTYRLSSTKNEVFYRKGMVGDWENYLTTEMIEPLNKIIEQKFNGSGLTF